jgi:hypothetical protein
MLVKVFVRKLLEETAPHIQTVRLAALGCAGSIDELVVVRYAIAEAVHIAGVDARLNRSTTVCRCRVPSSRDVIASAG